MSQATLTGDTFELGDSSLSYKTARISAMTFENKKIRNFVEGELEGKVLNATAGETELSHTTEIVRNDINPDRPADTHLNVSNLLSHYSQNSFDTIIYDPPFTKSRAENLYETDFPGYGRDIKEVFHALLRPGGKLIQFGYTSDGMPFDLGYTRDKICIINVFGRMYDMLITVDRHKPASKPTYGPLYDEKIVMNGSNSTNGSSRPTQQVPINTTYTFSKSKQEQFVAMKSFLAEHIPPGRTLDLYSTDQTSDLLPLENPLPLYEPQIFKNGTQHETGSDRLHFSIPPTEISDSLSQSFSSIIFAPNTNGVFREQTNGKGTDRVIKDQIDALLVKNGTVIQIGPTTTLMPASKMSDGMEYTREAVGVFSYPGCELDTYITIDREAATEYSSTTDSVERSFKPVRHGPTKVECHHCGEEWYFAEYPAISECSCTTCGATPNEWCGVEKEGHLLPVNPQTPREGIHMERENQARRKLESMACPENDGGHVFLQTPQYSPFIP